MPKSNGFLVFNTGPKDKYMFLEVSLLLCIKQREIDEEGPNYFFKFYYHSTFYNPMLLVGHICRSHFRSWNGHRAGVLDGE
jgi:hypothetical protein